MDYLADTSLQKLHILRKQFLDGDLPAFIKNANIAEEKPDVNAPLGIFGDPVKREFPCHTKVATWLSCLYFWGSKHNDEQWESSYPQEKAANRLEKAAKFWGVLPAVKQFIDVMEKKSEAPNRRLTDDDYALVVNYGSERVRRFPIVNAATVKKAAANLRRYRVSYPYAWRKKAARNILEKAMAFDASVGADDLDYLLKASGAYMAEPQDIALRLRIRAHVFPDEIRDRMRKAADAVEDGQSPKIDVLCNLLDAADRQCKKYALYNDGMPMPEEVCYAGMAEKAAAAEVPVVQLTTGTTFTLDAIKDAGLEPFTALKSDYVTELAANDKGDLDMDKVAAILPTIPRDDATLLEKAFKAVGVTPAEKEAARDTQRDFSMRGIIEVFGQPDNDFSGVFKLRHGEDVHEDLRKKQEAMNS